MRTELGSADIAERAVVAACELWENEAQGAEVEGMWFRYLGEGTSRIAVQGPDGVVYKVNLPEGTRKDNDLLNCPVWDQQSEELALFDSLAGHFNWIPEYWPWRDDVLAMRYYRKPTREEYTSARYAATLDQIATYAIDVSRANTGIDAEGDIYLIDGGCSNPNALRRFLREREAA